MSDQTVIVLVALGTGALFAWAGWYLGRVAKRSEAGDLPPNPMVGVRTKYTMASDQAWFAAHRAAAPQLVLVARGSILGGLLIALSSLLAFMGFMMTATIMIYAILTLLTCGWIFLGLARGADLANSAGAKEAGIEYQGHPIRSLYWWS